MLKGLTFDKPSVLFQAGETLSINEPQDIVKASLSGYRPGWSPQPLGRG
jgi:hypothetical protein